MNQTAFLRMQVYRSNLSPPFEKEEKNEGEKGEKNATVWIAG